MKKRVARITAALAAAVLLAGCGSISGDDGGLLHHRGRRAGKLQL